MDIIIADGRRTTFNGNWLCTRRNTNASKNIAWNEARKKLHWKSEELESRQNISLQRNEQIEMKLRTGEEKIYKLKTETEQKRRF